MNNHPSRWKARSKRSRNEQGITLITTLLLLLLLIGMSLTMVLAVSSESLINGFYGRYRGSFYAADSGVAAGRQQLMNLLGANMATGFNPATQPIANATTAASNAGTSMGNSYNAFTNVNTAGSWQERFLVKNVAVTFPVNGCSVQGGDPGATCANPVHTKAPITAYVYSFPYTFTVVGQSRVAKSQRSPIAVRFCVNAPTSPPTYNQSFAAWGMFIGTYALCSADLVPARSRDLCLRTVHGTSATPVPTPSPTQSDRWAHKQDGITVAAKRQRRRQTELSRPSTAVSTFARMPLRCRRTRSTRSKLCWTESAYHHARLASRSLAGHFLKMLLAVHIRRLHPAPACTCLTR